MTWAKNTFVSGQFSTELWANDLYVQDAYQIITWLSVCPECAEAGHMQIECDEYSKIG